MLPSPMRSVPTPASSNASTPFVPRLTTHRPLEVTGVSNRCAPCCFSVATSKNGPLFSISYKLLSQQTLCYQLRLRCPLYFFRAASHHTILRRPFFCLTAVFSLVCSLIVRKKHSRPLASSRSLFATQNRRLSATWTCFPHPTIIAALHTVQVHG